MPVSLPRLFMRSFEADYAAVILPIAHLTIHPHDKNFYLLA